MPVLLVNNGGTGEASFETDRFTLKDLFDKNGSAFIVHALPDNYANIPERYGDVDQETLATGDSGDRIACGAIQKHGDN
jgi:Cu-Zn family superoxide dismutase